MYENSSDFAIKHIVYVTFHQISTIIILHFHTIRYILQSSKINKHCNLTGLKSKNNQGFQKIIHYLHILPSFLLVRPYIVPGVFFSNSA